jgi:hypothetical protein
MGIHNRVRGPRIYSVLVGTLFFSEGCITFFSLSSVFGVSASGRTLFGVASGIGDEKLSDTRPHGGRCVGWDLRGNTRSTLPTHTIRVRSIYHAMKYQALGGVSSQLLPIERILFDFFSAYGNICEFSFFYYVFSGCVQMGVSTPKWESVLDRGVGALREATPNPQQPATSPHFSLRSPAR